DYSCGAVIPKRRPERPLPRHWTSPRDASIISWTDEAGTCSIRLDDRAGRFGDGGVAWLGDGCAGGGCSVAGARCRAVSGRRRTPGHGAVLLAPELSGALAAGPRRARPGGPSRRCAH